MSYKEDKQTGCETNKQPLCPVNLARLKTVTTLASEDVIGDIVTTYGAKEEDDQEI